MSTVLPCPCLVFLQPGQHLQQRIMRPMISARPTMLPITPPTMAAISPAELLTVFVEHPLGYELQVLDDEHQMQFDAPLQETES